MQNHIGVYPISANPPTLGHADIMRRASSCFCRLYWVAAINPDKKTDFPIPLQLAMMEEYVRHYKLTNVVIEHVQGSMVHYATQKGAKFIIRGIRNTNDLQLEMDLSTAYRGMNDMIETICFMADPKLVMVSSNLVRQIAKVKESIKPYVLPPVAKIIEDHYKRTLKL